MIVQACLNGRHPPGFHPRLPTSPEDVAADAAAAVLAGAQELHLHVRGPDGAESLAPAAVGATVAAVRAAVPGTLIGISTGEWIEGDDDRRLELIAGWCELPDHASVNLAEPGAPAVIERLVRLGVGVEAGLASVADAERLVRLDLARLAFRVLVEIDHQQDLGVAIGVADGVLSVLARASVRRPILLHGFGATVWPFVERAFRAGFSTRVGLEDGDRLPDGSRAAGNAELVGAAVRLRERCAAA